jgi:peptide/nickel transport system substrate-binding protein
MQQLCRLVACLISIALPAGAADLEIAAKLAPSAMDPHYHSSGENNGLLPHLYSRLVEESPGLEPTPGLALSWSALDATTWEFKLRPGVTFHDGSPFTAADVISTFQRIPRVENSPGSFLPYLAVVKAATAPDPLTLRITTTEPYPFLVQDLARLFILPRGIGTEVKTADFNSGKAAIGTGPYKLVRFVPGERLVMQRNEAYWGPRPEWDRVTLRFISNDTARVAALLAGDVAAIDEVPLESLGRLRNDPKIEVTQIASARVMYVAMDMDRDASPFLRDRAGKPLLRNPFKDVRVRKALSLAINREAIVDRVMEGAAVTAANLLPPNFEGTSQRLKPTRFDPDQARRLLAEAGYPDGFQISLHATNDRYPGDAKVAQALGQMWTRIGIETRVEATPRAIFFPEAAKQAYSVMYAGYGSSELSQSMRALVHSWDKALGYGTANRTRHSSPASDAALQEALRSMDRDRRNALLARAEEIALEEEAVIHMVYHPTYIYAAAKGLRVEPSADGKFLAQAISPAR